MLAQDPPSGISCWAVNDDITSLEARIVGPEGTIYGGGVFKLQITIPTRYPFEPPRVVYRTKIYHPNIDTDGRICLDLLKLPPAGSWKPSINISTLLSSLQLLMNEPNPDDPLMTDIAEEYRHHREAFLATAKAWTAKHAVDDADDAAAATDESSSEDESDSADDEDGEEEQDAAVAQLDRTAAAAAATAGPKRSATDPAGAMATAKRRALDDVNS